MKLITNHSRWCWRCVQCLSADNPGVELFGKVLCLSCVNVIRDALMAQVDEDKARER
jgi:hypothetical protein